MVRASVAWAGAAAAHPHDHYPGNFHPDLKLLASSFRSGREVDFVLTDQGKPIGFVECKWGDAEVSSSLRYLRQRFPLVPAWQVSAVGKKDFETPDGIRVAPGATLLRQLV